MLHIINHLDQDQVCLFVWKLPKECQWNFLIKKIAGTYIIYINLLSTPPESTAKKLPVIVQINIEIRMNMNSFKNGQILDKKYFSLISFPVLTFFESHKNIWESFKNIPKTKWCVSSLFCLSFFCYDPRSSKAPTKFWIKATGVLPDNAKFGKNCG